MFQRKLTKRERVLATFTATVISVGLLYVYVLEPVFTQWYTLHSRALELTQELAELQDLVANKNSIEKLYQDFEGAVSQGESEIDLEIALLGEIERLATNQGLEVSSIKPLSKMREGQFERLGVQLNAKCEGHQFVKFLHALQRPEHLLRAETISVVVGPRRPPVTLTLTATKLVKTTKGS